MPSDTVVDTVVVPPIAPRGALAIEQLEVRLGTRWLRLVEPCTLHAGRLYLLWGLSGSGKSTFARAVLGLSELADPRIPVTAAMVLTDADGQQHVLWDGPRYDPSAREQIAFFPQAGKLGFLDNLSTIDNLRLFSRIPRDEVRRQAEQLAERFHLAEIPQNVADASGGERIRLSAIRGLLPRSVGSGPPALILADEPTAGLDATAAQTLAREFIELARGGESIVVVITHDPRHFVGVPPLIESGPSERKTVRILECEQFPSADSLHAATSTPGDHADSSAVQPAIERHPTPLPVEIGQLLLESRTSSPAAARPLVRQMASALQWLGGIALSPLAFVSGLLRFRQPVTMLRQILLDTFGLGTQLFSLLGCLLIAATAAYFIFQQMPQPELVEPLLMPEILQATGHALIRVVLPLAACALVTAKLGAAQAARLASAVRGGLRETLALARWRVEAFALVPAVVAQMAAMFLATMIACLAGLGVAALVYLVRHPLGSLELVTGLMLAGLDEMPHWKSFLIAKVLLSGFLGGSVAALFGIVPATSEDDVATAVHRTLLWSVLCVIGCQCGLIIAEFARG